MHRGNSIFQAARWLRMNSAFLLEILRLTATAGLFGRRPSGDYFAIDGDFLSLAGCESDLIEWQGTREGPGGGFRRVGRSDGETLPEKSDQTT
jgi:hypothetical protein